MNSSVIITIIYVIGIIIGLFMGYYLWVNGYFDFFLN